jgi:hypothetical protein
MADVRTARRRPAKLSFTDGEVEVTPKDRPRFVLSAEKATEACLHAHQEQERFSRFEQHFLIPLHDWCMKHVGHVRACYLPLPGQQIRVFVVTTSPAFDFGLADDLADLELTLARAGWRVGIYQLPAAGEETLATFFDPDGALEIYADGEPAQGQGGA